MPVADTNHIWLIRDRHGYVCATIDASNTQHLKDTIGHVKLLVNGYNRMFPTNAPHVARRYLLTLAPVNTVGDYLVNNIEGDPDRPTL